MAFDLDGTLIDSRDDIADAVNECRVKHGLPPLSYELIGSYTGNGASKLMERSVPELLAKGANLDELMAEELDYYEARLVNKTRLYPGVLETLTQLQKKYHLAVITNKHLKHTNLILDKLGVQHFFSSVVGYGRITQRKPDPATLQLALEDTHATLEGSWMVGDHWPDMNLAKNTGIQACFCAYGVGNMGHFRAHAVIWSFPQLLSFA